MLVLKANADDEFSVNLKNTGRPMFTGRQTGRIMPLNWHKSNTMKLFPSLGIVALLLLAAACNLEVIPDDATPPGGDCPAVNFSYSTSGCASLPCVVQFSNLSTNDNGATYTWKLDGVSFSTSKNPSHSFAADGNYQVTLEVSKSGCGTLDTTITVAVNIGGGGSNITPFIKAYDLATSSATVFLRGVELGASGEFFLMGSDLYKTFAFKANAADGAMIGSPLSDDLDGNQVFVYQFLKTSDGGYITVGYDLFQNANPDAYLARFSSTLSPLGDFAYFDEGNDKKEYGYGVVEAGDGGFLIVGNARNFDSANPDSTGLFLVKTDANLTPSWHRYLFPFDSLATARRIVKTSTGYAIAGEKKNASGQLRNCFFRIDNNFNVIGTPTMLESGGSFASSVYDLVKVDDQNFILITLDGNVHKVNSAGTVLWSKAFQGGLRAGIMTSSGQLALAGYSSPGADFQTTLILMNHTTQVVEDQKFYQPAGASNSSAFTLRQLPDGGFLLGGGATFGSTGKAFLIRTDAEGNGP